MATMDQKTFDEINDRILRSARKHAYKFKDKDVDELSQDFWVQVLEYREKHGEYPMGFIEKICVDRVKDLIDYGQRRNAYSLTVDDEERSSWYVDKGYDLDTQVEVDELVNQFPKGSKERMFIDFYLEKSGIKMTGMTPPDSREQSGYTDSNLAKMLGFKGTNDSKWVKFRDRMKKIIRDYYEGQD